MSCYTSQSVYVVKDAQGWVRGELGQLTRAFVRINQATVVPERRN